MPASRDKKRARTRQIGLAAGIAAVAALLIFGGGAYLLTKTLSNNQDRPSVQHDTMVLAAGSFSSELDATGAVQSASVSAVTIELEGTVTSVAVGEGDLVEKGDLLFTLENEEVSLALAEALSDYRQAQEAQKEAKDKRSEAEAILAESELQLEKSKEGLEAARAAAQEHPDEPFDEAPYQEAVDSAQTAVDDAKVELSQQEASLSKAEKSTAKARSAYTRARREQGKLSIAAPQRGTVTGLKAEVGQQLSPTTAGTLASVVDTGKVNCVVQVPESKVGSISKGQKASVTCSALPGQTLAATVLKVADAPTEKSAPATGAAQGGAVMGDASGNGTLYGVTLAFDEPPQGLELGMAVSAKVHIDDYGTVYYVPATAVASGSFGMYVEAIVDEATVKQCSVTQVGTAPDDQLVIQGASLVEGMRIRTDLSGA
ncbi:MAG: efflux RND transporter periplasmic adaptor subunit [Coriobacteriales bacterium]